MDNLTFRYSVLLLDGLQVTPQSSKLTFIFLLIAYVFVMVSNIGILIQISAEKSLHQPMHILFCHLPVSDIMGTTVVIPRLLKDLLTDPSERYITYVECVFQAFFAHLYGTTSHTILMSHCRSFITNHSCDNASLFKLSCENTVVNNIYGLTFTVVLFTSSMGWVLLTYLRIAMVSIKTCSTHLAVYVILMVFGFVPIFLHRFSEYVESRKFGSVIFHVIPPGLNPMIYGLQVKEIRQRMLKLCRKKVNSS
ncbi:hypothetical protein PO909_008344 [Leuciscus waleckii]